MICPACKKNSLTFDIGAITGKYVCNNCGYRGVLALEKTKFRYFFTSSGLLVLVGKNAEQNEELIKKFTSPNEIVLHTATPGSPFCVLKGEAKAKDIMEAAIFCSCFSQDWKRGKKISEVHAFYASSIYKEKGMPLGTFGVKEVIKKIKVRNELYINIKGNIIDIFVYKTGKNIGKLFPGGNLKREDIIEKLKNYAKSKNLKLGRLMMPFSNIKLKLKMRIKKEK